MANRIRLSAADIRRMKPKSAKIAVLTGYNERDAMLLDSNGVGIILVGDSIGNVRLGYPDTTYVTMKDMLKAVGEVASAKPNALIVADMPIRSFDEPQSAIANARLFILAGADAVKLEGGLEKAAVVESLVKSGIQVMGHIGHTPQTDRRHTVEGKDERECQGLLEDAKALEAAGAFSIVVELADLNAAKRITASVSVPTIGIGAGPHTDGQVLVLDDLLGWTDFSKFPNSRPPKFLGSFWDRSSPENAVRQYDVYGKA